MLKLLSLHDPADLPWSINICLTTPFNQKPHGKNGQYLGKACASAVQKKNNDKQNNATSRRTVPIREGTENNLSVANMSDLCWWNALHARETRQGKTWKNGGDDTMRTGKEGRKHEWQMAVCQLMIKTVCVFAVIIVNVHKQKLPHGTFHIEHTETVLLS